MYRILNFLLNLPYENGYLYSESKFYKNKGNIVNRLDVKTITDSVNTHVDISVYIFLSAGKGAWCWKKRHGTGEKGHGTASC